MSSRPIVETRRDRKELVADAGFKQLSFMSVLAGVLAGAGAFAALAALALAVLKAADVGIDGYTRWQDLSTNAGFGVAGLLFLAFLFGGYVAGRMARRAGVMQGTLVFVLGAGAVVGAAALTGWLRGENVAEWQDVTTVAGIAAVAGMLVGALAGALMGERWHSKLLARALDPRVGAEAEARRTAEKRSAQAEELRTSAFRRVRATTPGRTKRVDDEADTVALDRDREWEREHDRTQQIRRWDPSHNGHNGHNGDNGGTKEARANDLVDRAADEPVATGRRTGR